MQWGSRGTTTPITSNSLQSTGLEASPTFAANKELDSLDESLPGTERESSYCCVDREEGSYNEEELQQVVVGPKDVDWRQTGTHCQEYHPLISKCCNDGR